MLNPPCYAARCKAEIGCGRFTGRGHIYCTVHEELIGASPIPKISLVTHALLRLSLWADRLGANLLSTRLWWKAWEVNG